MNLFKKTFKIILLFILPLSLPVIFLFASFYSIDFIFMDQIIHYGARSIIYTSILMLIFQLVLDLTLSFVGLSPSKREKMSKDKFFTALILEAAVSFSSIILGYRFMKVYNIISITLFKNGLLFLAIAFTIFDILFFLAYTKFGFEKYLNDLIK